ncbi:MAG: PKD domain-containing protein, partial [Candidatus Staskawiczbacteria bacterium]
TPHNVVLKVKNTNLCENTYQTTVQAQPSPNANFAFTPVICDGNPVQFTDMSSPLTGSPIASYLWDFGDPSSPNNTSTDRSPQHLFTAAGSYIVTLTVTNQMGCINTKTLSGNPLVVNPHPDIDFTSALGSTAFEATFTSQVNPAQNVGNNVYWEFGDGLMGAGSPITHAFPGPGNYTVKCKAIDMVTGCTDSVLHNVVLGAPPAACFTANPPNQCQNAVILFQACPPGGLITSETWDFGDGLPPVVYPPPYPISPSHAYAAPGWKHVVRTINAGTATEATWSIDVYIYEAPTANFIWFSDPAHLHQHQACDGQDVYFSDASFANSTPAGTIYKWAWDFGDPASGPSNTSTIANPTHTFTSGIASFNVSLIVWENLQDCPSPATPITVNINTPIPVTFSNNNNVCIDQTVNFTTDPITLPPANYTWLWDFGDGNTSATPGSVSHLYAAVGNYVVTLTLTDLNGCSKSYSKTISIIPKPIANFTFTTPTCFGAAIQFTDLSTVP